MDEPFMLIGETNSDPTYRLFDDVVDRQSARTADHDFYYLQKLRLVFPDLIVTTTPSNNIPLLAFAAAGHATYEVDKVSDSYSSWRGYSGPSFQSRTGSLGEAVHFAKYRYVWKDESFVLYTVGRVQYVLKEPAPGEHILGPSRVTDELIKAVGSWLLDGVVWVYDRFWTQDKSLYAEVEKMSWDKVILDGPTKSELQSVTKKFFSSKKIYDDLGVPWKRGLMFHGPPGNGKTITIKALMHSLLFEMQDPIPALYVKAAPQTFDLRAVFSQARALAPCLLVLEDVETIVTPETRSYFFNQMDGLASNSGLFVVASTNFLDKLDPGLTKRPSRFDRLFLFPNPNEHERILYCQFWRSKLARKRAEIKFPEWLCRDMAQITEGFSFAFLQECFVASLLTLAHRKMDVEDPEQYELWVVFKEQAKLLRKQIDPKTNNKDITQPLIRNESPSRTIQPHEEAEYLSIEQLTLLRGEESKRLPEIPGKYYRISGAAFEYF